ncbi:hypothetical protein B0H14DRAFT_2754393 [Mycena olivaceomarginata]|nr:hypothetical protein B0H14DRAFT_2754393 [Mycena olivaceomarginata]
MPLIPDGMVAFAICTAQSIGIVTVRPGGRTAPKPAVQWTVRRRYGRAGSLTTPDGTGRWMGRPSTVDGRDGTGWLSVRPSAQPSWTGTVTIPSSQSRPRPQRSLWPCCQGIPTAILIMYVLYVSCSSSSCNRRTTCPMNSLQWCMVLVRGRVNGSPQTLNDGHAS